MSQQKIVKGNLMRVKFKKYNKLRAYFFQNSTTEQSQDQQAILFQ